MDLTLKLSLCGENVEERRLIRSSSLVGGEIGSISVPNWCSFGPSIERSSSLPIDGGERMVLERQKMVAASELHGPRNSSEGVIASVKEIPLLPKSRNTKFKNQTKKLNLPNYCSLKGDVMEKLRQMPTVTTTGDGPNGKRIEGFLYKYRSGEVCIVCVCHGSFLTPKEFVIHAGGKEVANPMKHITVYPFSF
ncbi:ninja-family protein AFP3-like [Vicia villosa]|uniref:ninja-family protein AFP3-like n=1 Tax=Vicia villosa TaxID=3911 RepID=UPI00273BE2F9|nr:ninja-family protein AFP3-like [Vicia villosa]